MADKKNASEAEAKAKQEQESEAGKVQVDASEKAKGKEQEQAKDQKPDVESLKETLLADEGFLDSVMSTDYVKGKMQSERDTFASEQTIPLKQQLEEVTRVLAENTKANDPVIAEIARLKEAGEYEAALRLSEEQQQLAVRETAAESRGRQAAGREILDRVSKNPAFADLSSEDWRGVYANAATEAQKQGRSYITVDEYVAEASIVLRRKERETMTKEGDDDLQTKINAGVEAAMKERNLGKREDKGGGEDIGSGGGGGGGGGDDRTDAEIKMDPKTPVSKLEEIRKKEKAGTS